MSHRKITVRVTQEMIDQGEQRSNTRCPTAIALAAADPQLRLPRVTRDEIRFSLLDMQKRFRIRTPDIGLKFIDGIDIDKQAVRPIEFVIDTSEADEIKPQKRRAPQEITRKHTPTGTGKPRSKRARFHADS